MNVLQFCIRIPYPPNDGGSMAMYNLSESLLSNGALVDVFALNTLKHFIEPKAIDVHYSERYNLSTCVIDTNLKWYKAFVNLFTSDSYNIIRFYSDDAAEKLKTLLLNKQYDIVQLESVFVSQYIPLIRKYSKAKIVLRAHNVEHIIWQRLTQKESNPIKQVYLGLLARRLMAYENEIIHDHDAVLPITIEDQGSFKEMNFSKPIHVVPLGVNREQYQIIVPNDSSSIYHLGSMDWLPNLEAIQWYLNKIHPLLVQKEPNCKVHLAGKGMPDHLFKFANEQLKVEGKIDNPMEYASDKGIMIVPLLSGGGMRVKIIEAMAMGKAIVSTSIGAEGIDCRHGEDIMLADRPEEFVTAIQLLLRDAALRKRIGENARRLAFSKYENRTIGKSLLSFYESLMV
ncbi:MAG TPA: glycosyltransferase family 4 protein [Bacteroidia bacterium]|nr:glycosyltransferase family 4 protein [Bacteroidia bacterium]HNT80124.1 glycosyltransferase family 4 protein [Bacteroidia bacterium]